MEALVMQWGIFFVFRYLTFQFRKENVSNLHRLLENMEDFILLYFLQILANVASTIPNNRFCDIF
jgi:hypothetical protein